jgi:NAD(P)-dependent dehydrogenase (short-subunit alcohol dehydrogenase family)
MARQAGRSERVALVTGAASGIGRETVRQLAERGFHVYLTARGAAGRTAAKELDAGRGRVEFLPLDVTRPAAIAHVAHAVRRLDVLVNNAAILEDRGDALAVTTRLFERTLRTNTLAPLLVAQAFWRHLERSLAGRIVNVSSGWGAFAEMEGDAPAYSFSKAALNAVTKHLAWAGRARGIAVNSVCPGWVRTEMGGPGADRPVEEGADTVVWLADEAPQELTGSFLRDRKMIAW